MQKQLFDVMYPELGEFDAQTQRRLLIKAKEGNFDFVETLGLAIALALTVYLTQSTVSWLSFAGRFAGVLLNFVVAIPLLFVLGGPLYLRRTKRHLADLVRQEELLRR